LLYKKRIKTRKNSNGIFIKNYNFNVSYTNHPEFLIEEYRQLRTILTF
jgi:hypothetical protein